MALLHLEGNSVSMRINGLYPDLNTAEKILADFMMSHSGDVITKTIEQLADEACVSYSTVFRFCKKLGFKGYKELKTRLIQDIAQNYTAKLDFSEYEVNTGDSTDQICEKTFYLFNRILADCASLIDIEHLQEAVRRILGARTISIIGAGASAASSMYARTRMIRLGIPCNMESDPTIFMMQATLMTPQDILLAISSSGRTASIVKATEIAKARGASVISISDYRVSPLQKSSDVNLFTTARIADTHLNVDMPLTIGQIAIIDILYFCCMDKLGNRGIELYKKTKQAADSEKKQ